MATVRDLIFGPGATDATDAVGGVYYNLAQRDDIAAKPELAAVWIQKTIWELTADYEIQQLQRPYTSSFISGKTVYTYADLIDPADAIPNRFNSFFMYYDQNKTSGINLQYKTIDTLKQMLVTPGCPSYFSRFGNKIYIAPNPDQDYFFDTMYQVQHPFSSPVSLDDEIEMPDEWLDIIEFGASERGAIHFRMLDYAAQYHTVIFGDPEFERSSGGKGQPGLIFRRVSALERDTTSQMRSIRIMR